MGTLIWLFSKPMTRAPVRAPETCPVTLVSTTSVSWWTMWTRPVKLEEAGARATMGRVDLGHAAGSDSRSYYEIKYRGPDNQVIDITASGWIGT